MKTWPIILLLSLLITACSVDEPGEVWKPDGAFSFVLYNEPNLRGDTLGPFAVLYYDGASKDQLHWSELVDIVLAPGDTSEVFRCPWSFVSVCNLGPAMRTIKESSLSPDSITTIQL